MGKIRKTPRVELLEPLPRLDLRLALHTRQEEALIRRLEKIPERRAVGVLFERHGCLRCQTRALPHAGNGLCSKCRGWAYYELRKIDQEIARGELAASE